MPDVFKEIEDLFVTLNKVSLPNLRNLESVIDKMSSGTPTAFTKAMEKSSSDFIKSITRVGIEGGKAFGIRFVKEINAYTGEIETVPQKVEMSRIEEISQSANTEALLNLGAVMQEYLDAVTEIAVNPYTGAMEATVGGETVPVEGLESMQKAMGGITEKTGNVTDAMGAMEGAAGPAGMAMSSMQTILSGISRLKLPGMKQMSGLISGVQKLFSKEFLQGAVDIIVELVNWWIELTGVMQPFEDLLDFLTGTIKAGLAPALEELYDVAFSPEIMALIEEFGGLVADLLIPTIRIFTGVLTALIDSGAIDSLTTWIEDISVEFENFVTVMQPVADDLVTLLTNLLSAFTILSDGAWAGDDGLNNSILGLALGMDELTGVSWDEIIDSISSFADALARIDFADPTTDFLEAMIDIRRAISGVGDAVASIAGSRSWSQLTAAFNSVNTAITSALETIKDLMIRFDIRVAAIPTLAEGGMVMSPTLAIVGEAGPEAVIPFEDLDAILTAARGGEGGGAMVVNVSGIIGDQQVELIGRELWKAKNRSFV